MTADAAAPERRRSIRMVTVGDARCASTRHRALAHVPALERAGFDVEHRPPSPAASAGALARRWARLSDLAREVAAAPRADLVFIQRVTFPPPFAGWLRRRARRVVLDVDDAIDLPPPGRAGGRRYRRNFAATAHAADLVVCGNAELAARVPHERTLVLPTAIDVQRYAPGCIAPPAGPHPGWVGHSSNFGYLEALAGSLRELSRRHPGLRLIVAADRPPSLPGVEVDFRRWRLEDEVRCFGGIAVGLMPLADTPWARSKCAFKAIQYMALGIPAVVSPVGANAVVVRDGETGLLAATPGDWFRSIDRLLGDEALRRRLARNGRREIERHYALDRVAPALVEALTELAGGRDPRC